MLHELWEEAPPGEEHGYPLFVPAGPRGDGARATLLPCARLVWTVEADSIHEAMTLFYEHQGWGAWTTQHPEIDTMPYRDLGWE